MTYLAPHKQLPKSETALPHYLNLVHTLAINESFTQILKMAK